MNRRSFFRRSLVYGLGLPSLPAADLIAAAPPSPELPESQPALTEYERILTRPGTLNLLGHPRSWSVVRRGLHPIGPERVVVMNQRGGDGWLSRDRQRDDRLRDRLEHLPLPAEKLDLILRLMHVLTAFYGRPHLFEPWVTGLASREALGSTGIGHGFGLLHQFQAAGQVGLLNAPVDWWLALFPGGIGWEAMDGQPVYAMLAQVFPPYHRSLSALKLRVYELTSRVGLAVMRSSQGIDPTAWRQVATLNRIAAARQVNQAIFRCIAASPV